MKSRFLVLSLKLVLLASLVLPMGCGGSGSEAVRVIIRSLLQNSDLGGLQPVHLVVKGEQPGPSNRLLPGESREATSFGDGRQPALLHVARAVRNGVELDSANLEILGPFEDDEEVRVLFTWDGANLVGSFR
ncbi:MAG: hypothetical protein AMXMBFR81_12140 [Chthonomonas sp.]